MWLLYSSFHKVGLLVGITTALNNQVELDTHGYIKTYGKTFKTNISGVFAAGDIQDNKYQQAIIAAGSGAIVALDVEEFLSENM